MMQPLCTACDHADACMHGDDEAVLVIKDVEAECGDGDYDHAWLV